MTEITYKDKTQPEYERVRDLLNRMSIEEKVRQINMYAWLKENWTDSGVPLLSKDGGFDEGRLLNTIGDNAPGMIRVLDAVKPQNAKLANRLQKYAVEKTRLGIPFLFISEAPHGYTGEGGTVFPQNIAMASAFSKESARAMGETIASEARSVGINIVKGPVLDIALDPRWGRVEETFGEDPYLTERLGVEVVKGLQGDSLATDHNVISMLKHFTAHGAPEGGHNCGPAHMGERELREAMLPAFEAAIREGGALAVMSAYNDIDGVLCTANRRLLIDILRNEMGFEGFVQSDASAIKQVYSRHCAASDADAVKQCVESGMDMQNYDYKCDEYEEILIWLLKSGELDEKHVDRAVSSVLQVKFRLGLFENPYIEEDKAKKTLGCAKHKAYAMKAARESICLLKNDKNLLPLDKHIKSIAVIGPNAAGAIAGSYVGSCGTSETLLDSIKRTVSKDTKVYYAKGCELVESGANGSEIVSAHSSALKKPQSGLRDKEANEMILEACEIARKSEIAVIALGEQPWVTSSEGFDRANLSLTGKQLELIQAVYETGAPVIAALFNGRPLAIEWVDTHVPAIVEAWYQGQNGGAAVAEVLFGEYNPAGRLPVSFPRDSAQLPIYYNHKHMTRNKYIDLPGTPLYSFGHGLSYTEFAYSNLAISPLSVDMSAPRVTVNVDITNKGAFDGDEVVQLYLSDLAASVAPREKTLKGFERIHVKAGETKRVAFTIGKKEMEIVSRDYRKVIEPGEFEVMVGGSSKDGLKGRFVVLDS